MLGSGWVAVNWLFFVVLEDYGFPRLARGGTPERLIARTRGWAVESGCFVDIVYLRG